MKKTFLFLICIFIITGLSARVPLVDSLNKLLAHTKEDTVRVEVLVKLSFYEPSFQRAMTLTQEGLALAQKIKYEKGEGDCLHQMGNNYWTISNFPMALHNYLEALKIMERIGDKKGMAYSYYGIGDIYAEQGDYKNAINSFQKAVLMHSNDNYRLANLYSDFASAYESLNRQDSALIYYQRSYEYFNLSKDKFQLNLTLNGLGKVQLDMGNTELALGYYREAIRNGISYNDTLGLSFTYLSIARLYNFAGSTDSSIFYASRSMFFAQRTNVLKNVIESGKLLSKLYENKNDKEALRYLQISQTANDSLYSRARAMELQNMFFNETERQNELTEKEQKDARERKLNIQYALIALSIVIFIILFLLLSRSFITNTKLIEFFGVLALLIVFEFLDLLLHPFLATITNNTPLLMLLALVCIAAFLIPAHNALEHWTRKKLVEKNKKIRLMAAKRTIEKLEKE